MRTNTHTAPCIYCESTMQLKTKGNRYFLAPICLPCRKLLTLELGENWEQSAWWREMKSSYYAERNANWRADGTCISLDKELADNPYFDLTKGVEFDEQNRQQQSVLVSGIVTRLYTTYGYGNRRIHAILTNVYKLQISRRTVAQMLARIKIAGIVPDEDAEFWRTWHRKLERLEHEYNLSTKEK